MRLRSALRALSPASGLCLQRTSAMYTPGSADTAYSAHARAVENESNDAQVL
jgi:hypothetical protein